MKKILLWVLAGFIGLILIGVWADKQKPVSQKWPRDLIVPHDFLCGRGRSDASNLMGALSREDREAVTGLFMRNKALVLRQGTAVRAYEPISGFVYMRVRSGAQIGETCWVPEGWLR